jgi:DNA-binding response OmpR family regulator
MTAPAMPPRQMIGRLDRVSLAAFLHVLARAERNFVSARMIAVLAQPRGRIVSYRELADGIYGDSVGPGDTLNVFRIHAHLLRKQGVPIIAHKGRGYSLERPA